MLGKNVREQSLFTEGGTMETRKFIMLTEILPPPPPTTPPPYGNCELCLALLETPVLNFAPPSWGHACSIMLCQANFSWALLVQLKKK